LVYARAGHDRPFLLRGIVLQELSGQGTPLGLFDPSMFHVSEESIQLKPGDRLVLYTDGITDVLLDNGKISDHRRFQLSLESLPGKAPEVMCALIFENLSELQGRNEQFDDMALLIVGVK
jgi:phosphoserine phosphatase RsbU/P